MARLRTFLLVAFAAPSHAASSGGNSDTTCLDVRKFYQEKTCCDNPDKKVETMMIPNPTKRIKFTNYCAGMKPELPNVNCTLADGTLNAIEQAGGDVTLGYQGGLASGVSPIDTTYHKSANDLCVVNVHWHKGAEHRSQGQYDENGKGPSNQQSKAIPSTKDPFENYRYGFACLHYNANDPKFTTEYDWKHCKDMQVGETYEVHWPHSSLGACGTPNQYQSPFYDGVFCNCGASCVSSLTPEVIAANVGVQAQVFTVVNDEAYFYPDLIRGMIVDPDLGFGSDVAIKTGSTTGTSRSNTICSQYAPVTWQVDRKCHLISASSFDKLCADMKQQNDDFTDDLYPHGARELVADELSANNRGTLDAPVNPVR